MTKKILSVLLAVLFLLATAGCNDTVSQETSSQETSVASVESTSTIADNSSQDSTPEPRLPHEFYGTGEYTNQTMQNADDLMKDLDGPSFCVYSEKNFTAVSMDLELSAAEYNIYRNHDPSRHVNAYIFLGADVYDETDDYWINCADAGLTYSGKNGWHLFYNLFRVEDPENTPTWYESERTLDASHDYRLTLTVARKDGSATLTVYDLNQGRVVDRATFELYRALSDGSNVSFLTNFALDYPENMCYDTQGNPSDDWVAVTEANTDCGIYLRNIRVFDCKLYRGDTELDWTAELTRGPGIWPDASAALDYPCTSVHHITEFTEYIIDLDMNRPE